MTRNGENIVAAAARVACLVFLCGSAAAEGDPAAGKRKTVFEPFERLRSDLNEGVSGTGIGLTISRELAQLHGGKLVVCPQYREGARFILTLPIQPIPTSAS